MSNSSAAVRLSDQAPTDSEVADEVLASLPETPPRLPSKYFYDERGSQLFDAICELPEYYPTRTELAIMREHAGHMARRIGPGASLVEFGSGSSLKTRLLLEALEDPVACVLIDISADHLFGITEDLAKDFPHIEFIPVAGDFTQALDLPRPRRPARRQVVYFPGSTIGNFARPAAAGLLDAMARIAGPDGGALVGVDLVKDRSVLEAAYNDSQGVTAAFNRNMLVHLNRVLDGDFDPARFGHHAPWVEADSRIEMHLVSRADQRVTLAGHEQHFAKGDYILTEYSHKYTLEGFAELAAGSGFRVGDVWTDAGDLFSVQYLEPAAG